MATLPSVTDASFDNEVLQSDSPVLVDFSATWCGPCKQLAPVLEKLAHDYAGRFKFVVIDVDHARQTAAKFNVMSVPTLLVFKKGQILNQLVGVRPAAEIARVLNAALEAPGA